jgi:phospholipid/cholesterol/gamma-HCH transport system substrate-binding protein
MKLSNEIKIGIFGIATLVILFSGYNFLKSSDFFSNNNRFFIFYKNVEGLGVANEVQINGFKVGKVISLKILPERNNQIMAVVDIDKNIKVYKNSIFKINSVPLSTTVIKLETINGTALAQNGDTLIGESSSSIINQFTEQMEPIKQKAQAVAGTIDSILTQLKSMMDNGGKTGLQNSLSDIQLMIHNLRETTEKVNGLMKSESERLDNILKNVDAITTNLKNNNATISHALTNLDKITDDVAKSNLKQTIENTNNTIADLSSILNKIKSGNGSLGMLVNDDKLYLNLKSSSENLDKLIIDLKANPKRYVHFSVFGGKDKKDGKE